MEDLTTRICWELVKKEGNISIWRKPLNNSCYVNRGTGAQPTICDSNDDPDNVWYALLHTFKLWLNYIIQHRVYGVHKVYLKNFILDNVVT